MKHLRRFSRKFFSVFGHSKADAEMDREIRSHLALLEDELLLRGIPPAEARRQARISLGGLEQTKIAHRQERGLPFVEGLWSDVVFGCRQLWKRKVTTSAVVVSLGLAVGSCTAAYRLIDALLLRPLPIKDPGRLYGFHFDGFSFQGEPLVLDEVSYPAFVKMREAVNGQAQLVGISPAGRIDLTYATDHEMEKAQRLYVSGSMFPSFGLQPAIGRLLTEEDDRVPGERAYAVISYSYWNGRFARDPQVIGRSLRIGTQVVQVVGVAEQRFTGTEPGVIPDIFLPIMMYNPAGMRAPGNEWLRVFVRPNAGVAIGPLQEKMDTAYRRFEHERAKGWTPLPIKFREEFPRGKLILTPVRAGLSQMVESYRVALLALGVLVTMVLLIACANVANLMTAQTTSREREMALRMSLGAGRWRLMQMVMVESALLALIAAGLGWLFSVWAAPFVVNSISLPDSPVQLVLSADWRALGFGVTLSIAVALLFGVIPALRTSAVKPATIMKGGDAPLARRRSAYVLVAAQVTFCFVVLFLSGLFVRTFRALSEKPLGFLTERILLLDTVTQRPQPVVAWDQMVEHLKMMPGVQSAALASWGLVGGQTENNLLSIHGVAVANLTARSLNVSPGWLETMKIPLLSGRDFRPNDASPQAAIVSKTFARAFFDGENPVGKTFEMLGTFGKQSPFQIVGLVEDAAYKDVHDPMLPVIYVPLHSVDTSGLLRAESDGTFVVRTAGKDPTVLAETLREEVQRVQPELRVSNIETQMELVRAQTIRERLLASLAEFFSMVALLLATVGLYGVLHYSVVQREREIGIRIALGAAATNIARIVSARVLFMVFVGAVVGLVAGLGSVRYVASLLYGVRGNDVSMMILPGVMLLCAAGLAAVPTLLRAVRIDPAVMLRAE